MDSALPASLVAPYMRPLTPIPTQVATQGALTPPIHCLMCDIYGTLMISGCGDPGEAPGMRRPAAGLRELLDRHGFECGPEAVLAKLSSAIADRHAQQRARGVDYPEIDIEGVWATILPDWDAASIRRFAVEFEMVVNPTWPMPHLAEMLAACRDRKIRLGIVSNAQFMTPYLFEWFLGASLASLGFDAALTLFSYQQGVAKPSRRLFQTAAQRLDKMGIDPRCTAFIGNDMRKDILPAARVGFQTVLFAGDRRSLRMGGGLPPEETGAPDLIVNDLLELLTYVR